MRAPVPTVQRPYNFPGLNRGSWQACGLVHWWPVTGEDFFIARGGFDGVYSAQLIRDRVGLSGTRDIGQQRLMRRAVLDGAAVLTADGGDWMACEILNLNVAAFTGAATLNVWIKLTDATPPAPINTGWCQFDACDVRSNFPYTDGLGYISTFRGTGDRVGPITLSPMVNRALPHMVTITADSTRWRLYQNAILVHETTVRPSAQIASTAALHGDAVGRALAGQSWDWRLYNRSLSEAEVSALYAPSTRWNLYAPLPQRTWAPAVIGVPPVVTGDVLQRRSMVSIGFPYLRGGIIPGT